MVYFNDFGSFYIFTSQLMEPLAGTHPTISSAEPQVKITVLVYRITDWSV